MKTDRGRYATLPFLWDAVVDRSSPWPSRFLARLLDDARWYGMPATRRPAALWKAIASAPSVVPVLSGLMRAAPTRSHREDLDLVRDGVLDSWHGFAQRARRLPEEPPELAILALKRSASTTVFFFSDSASPLIVVKIPQGDDDRAAREAQSLTHAHSTGIAPAYLGTVGDGFAQEGLPGRPYRLQPIGRDNAATISWEDHHTRIAEALLHLTHTTAKDEPCFEITDGEVEIAVGSDELSDGTRQALQDAIAKVAAAERSVLQHRDVNAQNSLFEGPELVGIVDWEFARLNGMPGVDILNVALSHMEHGIALKNWSPPEVTEIFAEAWDTSPLWTRARAAAGEASKAAGLDVEPRHVETLFFGHRLARRSRLGGDTAWIAARMLEIACES